MPLLSYLTYWAESYILASAASEHVPAGSCPQLLVEDTAFVVFAGKDRSSREPHSIHWVCSFSTAEHFKEKERVK